MWQFDLSNVHLSESLYAPDSSFDFSAMTHISPKQVKKYLRSDGIIRSFSTSVCSNSIPWEFVCATSMEDRDYCIKSGSLGQVMKDFYLSGVWFISFLYQPKDSHYIHSLQSNGELNSLQFPVCFMQQF